MPDRNGISLPLEQIDAIQLSLTQAIAISKVISVCGQQHSSVLDTSTVKSVSVVVEILAGLLESISTVLNEAEIVSKISQGQGKRYDEKKKKAIHLE